MTDGEDLMQRYMMAARRAGKTHVDMMAAKKAQREGKRVLMITTSLTNTALVLQRHGALSEVVAPNILAPRFRDPHEDRS